MSAIVIIERLTPARGADVWMYSREWCGKDDSVTYAKAVAQLGYFSEADAWHEVERQGLRAAADEELLQTWVGSEGRQ